MLKRLFLVGLLSLVSAPAFAAGTIPFSLSQQFDSLGKPLIGCKLYTIQAGTTSTPQSAYQDSALTIALPNPQTCDSAGRLPQMFLADGTIKVRLTDRNGVTQVVADNIQVIGASSGGGGGGSVDPTTILATGDIKDVYGTGVLAGFVRANGRTIGSATSGATERANADTSALFAFLWNQDPNLTISGGRGVSAAADFAANKTIALPDFRDRVRVALGDMGNANIGLFGPDYCINHTTLGFICGGQTSTLLAANLPPYTPSGSVNLSSANTTIINPNTIISIQGASGGSILGFGWNSGGTIANLASSMSASFTGVAQGGTSTPVRTVQPSIFVTTYLKL